MTAATIASATIETFEEQVEKLSRDLKRAAETMTPDQARYVVDAYYQMQQNRIRSEGRCRSMPDEPHAFLAWLANQDRTLENRCAMALAAYSAANPLGRWARSIMGCGPVIAAGLLAHIDIAKAPTCGHIWNFAGLNPGVKWEKGKTRPWNAALKSLCAFKLGSSFVKLKNNERCFFGLAYAVRKQIELERNAAGENVAVAASTLEAKTWKKGTKSRAAYEQGQLPNSQIVARARRYAVKLFLSCYHEVGFMQLHGREAPAPYAIAILGHGHRLTAEMVSQYERQEWDREDAIKRLSGGKFSALTPDAEVEPEETEEDDE